MPGGTEIPKQPKGVNGAVPEPTWNDMRIHYSSNNLQGAGALAEPGAAPVVQMIRKRVKGSEAAFDAADIYYDKSDNRYYNGMTQEGEDNVTVTQDEYQEFKEISSKGKRTLKTTILAKAYKGTDRKFVKDIPVQEGEAVEDQRAEGAVEGQGAGGAGAGAQAADITVRTQVFSEGHAVAIEPKAVRLYAEGDMRHAASLARAFEEPGKYNQFINMNTRINPEDDDHLTPEVLIKATEYDPLKKLDRRYGAGSKEVALTRVTAQKGLEASFGDTTGDMTREVGETPGRKYDIIQATFFWKPDETSDENFTKLRDFMKNQRTKLKAGGKIRIILANKDTNYPGKEAYNHYRETADKLTGDPQLKELFTMEKIVFKINYTNREGRRKSASQTYADRLTKMGMNNENFIHTRTDAADPVIAYGDLMIVATPKG